MNLVIVSTTSHLELKNHSSIQQLVYPEAQPHLQVPEVTG